MHTLRLLYIIGALLLSCFVDVNGQALWQWRGEEAYLPDNLTGRYTRRSEMIEMRDGVSLYTVILVPVDKSKTHPIMMERTCYNASVQSSNLRRYAPYIDNNYIIVFQDVRGRNLSEGIFEDVRPFIEDKPAPCGKKSVVDEASDTYDTVEWLVDNVPCNNGRVGVKGISYPGFYATMAALSGHPAIKAVSPQAPVGDWFIGDDYHHNGAFCLADIVAFDILFEYENNPMFVSVKDPLSKMPKLVHTDIYTDYLKLGTYSNMLEQLGSQHFFLDSCKVHPDYDEFWQSRAVVNGHLHGVKPAVMVVGGFFDKEDCYGALATYKRMLSESPSTELFLVEGPWFHGAWVRKMGAFWGDIYFGEQSTESYYMANIEYPFFAWYLEDKGEKPQPGALVYDSGVREFLRYDRWPAVSVKECTPYYLKADGSVSSDRGKDGKRVSYMSDPSKPVPYRACMEKSLDKAYMIDDQRFASFRPDVLCFETETLDGELVLRGEIEVDLKVDISSTDADFIVKVIDVFPDDFSWREEAGVENASSSPVAGYQLLLRGEPFRGKYRNGFSKPEPFVPGQPTRIKFVMPDISHTLKPGHRLMIQVQSSWFPLVDRNPQTFCNIYECDKDAYVKAEIGLYCGGEDGSFIKLPVVR